MTLTKEEIERMRSYDPNVEGPLTRKGLRILQAICDQALSSRSYSDAAAAPPSPVPTPLTDALLAKIIARRELENRTAARFLRPSDPQPSDVMDIPQSLIEHAKDLERALAQREWVERFWVVEAVNEDDTVLSPPAYWYGGFVGSTVAGHVGSDIHALCTRFQNAQTAEYVKCLLRNLKILPDRGHHWKIFKHVMTRPSGRSN